jgi:hypothetical protein
MKGSLPRTTNKGTQQGFEQGLKSCAMKICPDLDQEILDQG